MLLKIRFKIYTTPVHGIPPELDGKLGTGSGPMGEKASSMSVPSPLCSPIYPKIP